MKTLRPILMLVCGLYAFGQTSTTTPPVCPAGTPNTPYNYFGSTGIGYDIFSRIPSVSTGFGAKTGTCSNSFIDLNITTAAGSSNPNPGYSTIDIHYEYHLAHTTYWEFIADGLIGAAQVQTAGGASSVTSAMFGGGFAISGDAGYLLSKKVFHLPIVFHADYVVAPAAPIPNAAKQSFRLEIRKTF